MKKFILWLCKISKVDLVEPIKQETHVNYIHEKLPYTQITTQSTIHSRDFQTMKMDEYREYIIQDYKKEMILKITRKLIEEDILVWEEFTDYMTLDYKIRCSFYAAKKPQ